MRGVCWLLVAACWLAGCTSKEVVVAHSVPLRAAAEDIAESELVDVGIVFDSGVPEGEVDQQVLEGLIREGTFVQIRRMEAVYLAVLLRDTLRKSGNWGIVSVTPTATTAADLSVTGKILRSDGDTLKLHVAATDATGRVWIDKDYDVSTVARTFDRQRNPDLDLDPYQDVFNSVANDLAAAFRHLSAAERHEVRTVAGLRYAAGLSPKAFAGYVTENRDHYEVNRLPAEGDPMFDRTQRVRQREQLFLDTLGQHYEKFFSEVATSYNGWRQYARKEAIEIREGARWRTGMRVRTTLSSAAYGEQKLHLETLEDLSSSFDASIKPIVVEIQGTQHSLAGTAALQYAEWQDLLRKIFITESGFVPEDVQIYTEAEP